MDTNLKHTSKMEQEKTDLVAIIAKALFNILPPYLVGVMAKIANDVNDGRKLSKWGWAAIAFLSLSGTFLSNWICEWMELDKNKTLIITAFGTLFSEQIFKMLFRNGWSILRDWAKENMKFSMKVMDRESELEQKNNLNKKNNDPA